MYFIRKLKPPEMNVEAIIGISMVPILLIIFVFFGVRAMFGFIAFIELMVLGIQVNLYIRSKNSAFIWIALAIFVIFVFALDLAFFGLDKSKPEVPALSVGVIIAAGVVIYQIVTRRVKWRTREIMELSAMPVSDSRSGFTERPLSVGKIDANKLELEAFTNFIRKKLIAIPYMEEELIIYSLTSNYWKQIGLKRGYEDESWVSIDGDGSVNAYISKYDYLKFKDQFTFDQLCQSLGELFVEFFNMYKRGEGTLIMKRFDDLRLNPFIE